MMEDHFEITERNGRCSRMLKWCTAAECKALNVKIHPPACEYGDYSQFDFENLSVPKVEQLLLECGVNFDVFDAGECVPHITMKLLRTECFLMTTDSHPKKVLLMSE